MPSKNIEADGLLTLSYSPPVTVTGLELHAFQGYPDSTIVRVYNGSGGLIYTSSPIAVPGPSPVFFGYSAASIGSVTIQSQTYSWSTLIDNHEYGGTGATLSKSGICAGPVTLTASGCTANGTVAFLYGQPGVFIKNGNPCNGLSLGISNPTLASMRTANGAGTATLSFNAPQGACGRTVQCVDVASCTTTNTLIL